MPNSWGRPPRNDMWQDMQALAFWVLIIGVVGLFIFPNFFKDVYSRITDPTKAVTTDTGNLTSDLNSYGLELDSSNLTQDTSSILNSGYSSNVLTGLYGNKNEVSTGYWVIFVSDGEFNQLSVTNETYTFLTNLISRDTKADLKNTVILAANGQILKFTVSEEVYSIITNMAVIDTRTKT
ncbi:hypothetical protein [Desulfitobacterium metallireducens]|uniref:Uncharacterized protein n=1 Tax=Desulfitobacterium metallireducens DSM 15288 TaxID=871968 RepID=W0ECD0_9FIRM|nr:hypothetical protein [Desulfitobacterium metallireducens]AHF06711.1 hypothetical protein DESME_06300 [Desulfitobacterium metallireducens DSM 15288]